MELAKRLAKLGILRSAVEIFLSLEAWDAVVDCYTVLEDRKKGVSLVKERLAIKETPKLLVCVIFIFLLYCICYNMFSIS